MLDESEQKKVERGDQNKTSYQTLLEALKSTNPPVQEDILNPFLKLAPPAVAQNNIEFNQVFRLQPSEAFYSLYRQCYQSKDIDLISSNLTDRDKYLAEQVKLIDRRTLRWYQTLKVLFRDISELQYKLSITVDTLRVLKNSISTNAQNCQIGTKTSDQLAVEKRYREEFQKLKSIEESLEQYRQAKRILIIKITSAGYIYTEDSLAKQKEEDTNAQMPSLISRDSETLYPPYNYQISKPVMTIPVDAPFLKPEDFTPMTDTKWANSLAIIYEKVIKTNLINSIKEQTYTQDSNELSSVESCLSIQRDLKSLDDTIEGIVCEENQIEADSTEILKNAEANCDNLIANYQHEIDYRKNLLQPAVDFVRTSPLTSEAANLPEDDPEFIRCVDIYFNMCNSNQDIFQGTCAGLRQEIKNFTDLQNKAKADKESIKVDNEKVTQEKKAECEQRKKAAQASRDSYNASKVLAQERIKFLLYWNNPQVYDSKQITSVRVEPDFDALQDFYTVINQKSVNQGVLYRIHQFNFNGTGYFDQEGRSLEEFMKLPYISSHIAIFPVIDQNCRPSRDLLRAIIAPRQSHIKLNMPDIKFVETQELVVSWQRYALGALASAINLTPGEHKQIVVTKETKLTREMNQSRSEDSEQQRNVTSSFEDNLSNELSTSFNRSNSENIATDSKQDQKNSDSSANSRERSSTDNSAEKVHASGSYMGFNFGGDVDFSSTETDKTSEARAIEATISLSQSKNTQVMSSLSRQISAKNVDNRIQKVATNTSLNNKIDVTSSSSEQLEQDTSDKEIMKLTNPNDGRTVTYNLFQMQNVYRVNTLLTNIKLVVNTGRELVDGSGLYETKVYELEQFNWIFNNSMKSDFEVIMCAIIARKVLKNYTDLLEYAPKNRGIIRLRIKEGENSAMMISNIATLYKRLDLTTSHSISKPSPPAPESAGSSSSMMNSNDKLKDKLLSLRATLTRLQQFTFVFAGQHLISQREFTVNAPAYYMDSQLGLLPATEPYLEQRRQLALEEKRNMNDLIMAEAEYLRNSKPSDQTNSSLRFVSSPLAFFPSTNKTEIRPANDMQSPTTSNLNEEKSIINAK